MDGFDGERIVLVAAGARHSAALSADGVLFCWGDSAAGQLGLGEGRSFPTPQRVPAYSGAGIVWLGCGDAFTTALTHSGQVVCFGDNREGQCAQGAACELALRPGAVAGALEDRRTLGVAVGTAHVVALVQPPPSDADGVEQKPPSRADPEKSAEADLARAKHGLRMQSLRRPDHEVASKWRVREREFLRGPDPSEAAGASSSADAPPSLDVSSPLDASPTGGSPKRSPYGSPEGLAKGRRQLTHLEEQRLRMSRMEAQVQSMMTDIFDRKSGPGLETEAELAQARRLNQLRRVQEVREKFERDMKLYLHRTPSWNDPDDDTFWAPPERVLDPRLESLPQPSNRAPAAAPAVQETKKPVLVVVNDEEDEERLLARHQRVADAPRGFLPGFLPGGLRCVGRGEASSPPHTGRALPAIAASSSVAASPTPAGASMTTSVSAPELRKTAAHRQREIKKLSPYLSGSRARVPSTNLLRSAQSGARRERVGGVRTRMGSLARDAQAVDKLAEEAGWGPHTRAPTLPNALPYGRQPAAARPPPAVPPPRDPLDESLPPTHHGGEDLSEAHPGAASRARIEPAARARVEPASRTRVELS